MSSGIVFDIRKFSVHDGPGIRTAIFLKGCPLACPWCHNPEGRDGRPALLRRVERCVHCGDCARFCPLALDPKKNAGSAACADCETFGICAEVCPAEAIQEVGRTMTGEEIMTVVREDRSFYDESGGGVTFTGGEPLAQAGLLGELLDACRAEGIHTALETSGYARRELLLDIGHRVDVLLFDLKHADAGRGSELTGVDYGLCLGNLEAACTFAAQAATGQAATDQAAAAEVVKDGEKAVDAATASPAPSRPGEPRPKAQARGFAEIIVRIPIIPGCNDGPEDLEAAAALVARLPGRVPVHLLPYHDSARGKYRLWGLEYPLSGTGAPDDGAMAAALAVFTARGIATRIGG
jgi:pyruvate formate lyase activating enzyme